MIDLAEDNSNYNSRPPEPNNHIYFSIQLAGKIFKNLIEMTENYGKPFIYVNRDVELYIASG